MKIVTTLTDIPSCSAPIALTIGMFDGIHLGHQEIIKHLHKLTRHSGTRALLTFSNHPSHILTPDKSIPLVISFKHRLELLKKYGIHLVIALPFTAEFSQESYKNFLINLYNKLPFNELILGEGASFGKDCEGDAEHVKELAQTMNFQTHYLKKERYHKEVISSRFLRTLIEKRKIKKIKKMLGRPYSIWKSFDQSYLTKENKTLYCWSFEQSHLCALPTGVYGINFEMDDTSLPGIAVLYAKKNLNYSTLSVTVYLEKEPPNHPSVNLSFIEYLNAEIDPPLFESTPVSILKNLSTQPSLS